MSTSSTDRPAVLGGTPIRERDYPTIMGLTLMFSVLTLLGQLLADLLYCLVDPRVSVD